MPRKVRGTHKKTKARIRMGGEVSCGSRKLRLDGVEDREGKQVASVTLTKLDFETVEIRNPARPDGGPWIDDDPGEGPMVERQEMVLVGHKIRLGDHRQFRIVAFDGTEALVAVVGPGQEVG